MSDSNRPATGATAIDGAAALPVEHAGATIAAMIATTAKRLLTIIRKLEIQKKADYGLFGAPRLRS
ncbi:MAG TPA: hypothetical protein VJ865_05860, partial [Gemmatimonadaceae bacterium]|nr:hypothetical protein [Gemmatimonadaceae bacterium]